VSLLMDALRKAEAQKLAGDERPAQDASPGLALEPLEPAKPADGQVPASPPSANAPAPGKDRLPDLPKHLEELDEQFITPGSAAVPKAARRAAPPAAAPGGNSAEMAREHARKLFEVKQPGQKINRSFAIGIGLATVAAIAGIGGYFWWQLQPKGGLVASGTLPGAPPSAAARPPAAPTPVAAVQPAPSASTAAAPALTAAPPGPTVAQPAGNVPATTMTAPAAAPSADDAEAKPQRAEAKPPQPALATATPPPSPIRVSKAVQKTDPLLEQAYAAFNRGELDLAQAAWSKALAADPRNADALHGLAALAAQRSQPDEAATHYLRALEADPKDALALAGLLALKMPADTLQTESRIKTLLAEQPDSPYLNFALGNLYARSMRWAEAQQAFFKAHVAEPANPDYLFNLAVSLDQLRQTRPAVQYYNQALAAAAQQPAGFDAAQVATRLKVLQAAGQPH
jgi:Flp pilus assembly protein TadD